MFGLMVGRLLVFFPGDRHFLGDYVVDEDANGVSEDDVNMMAGWNGFDILTDFTRDACCRAGFWWWWNLEQRSQRALV